MLRIGFDASPLVRPCNGIGWHTFHLFRTLFNIDQPKMEFVGYLPTNQMPEGDYSIWLNAGKLKWNTGNKWRGWISKTEQSLDLFHGPNFKMPIQGRCGGVITIHDLWLDRYPQYSKKLFGQIPSFYRTRRRAWAAKRVITVSQSTADDVCEFYGLPGERVVVIPNGVSEEFFEETSEEVSIQVVKKYQLPTQKYVLFIGGASPRKNHKVLLGALAQCPEILKNHCLVIVGAITNGSDDVVANARKLRIDQWVVCVGRVSMDELRSLYKGAALFVFPSLYEGFGIPVIEAMASGVPVITSNSSALPEVAGEAAIFVDPQDEDALGKSIQDVLNDQQLRNRLQDLGRKRAAQFSWKMAASKTANLYLSLCR